MQVLLFIYLNMKETSDISLLAHIPVHPTPTPPPPHTQTHTYVMFG